jgi:SAM-dependent methyltransferase
MTRAVGVRHPINRDKTRAFFAERAARIASLGPLNAVLYQDRQPELAKQRSAHELSVVVPLLQAARHGSVVDLGCGTGRWAEALSPWCSDYLGLDFTPGFLESAAGRAASLPDPARFRFLRWDLADGSLPAGCSCDLLLSAGLLLYLNDEVLDRLLPNMAAALRPGGLLYLREPLGTTERLTLDAFFSEDLGTTYSSIYRGQAEFHRMLEALAVAGLEIVQTQPLYPASLEKHTDTRQHIFILRKTA